MKSPAVNRRFGESATIWTVKTSENKEIIEILCFPRFRVVFRNPTPTAAHSQHHQPLSQRILTPTLEMGGAFRIAAMMEALLFEKT